MNKFEKQSDVNSKEIKDLNNDPYLNTISSSIFESNKRNKKRDEIKNIKHEKSQNKNFFDKFNTKKIKENIISKNYYQDNKQKNLNKKKSKSISNLNVKNKNNLSNKEIFLSLNEEEKKDSKSHNQKKDKLNQLSESEKIIFCENIHKYFKKQISINDFCLLFKNKSPNTIKSHMSKIEYIYKDVLTDLEDEKILKVRGNIFEFLVKEYLENIKKIQEVNQITFSNEIKNSCYSFNYTKEIPDFSIKSKKIKSRKKINTIETTEKYDDNNKINLNEDIFLLKDELDENTISFNKEILFNKMKIIGLANQINKSNSNVLFQNDNKNKFEIDLNNNDNKIKKIIFSEKSKERAFKQFLFDKYMDNVISDDKNNKILEKYNEIINLMEYKKSNENKVNKDNKNSKLFSRHFISDFANNYTN